MTPLCALHHQLCVTRCSLGANVLNITHFDQSVYIFKLICCPSDDNLTLLHEEDKRLRGSRVLHAARCTERLHTATTNLCFNQDKSSGGRVTACISPHSVSPSCDRMMNEIKAKLILKNPVSNSHAVKTTLRLFHVVSVAVKTLECGRMRGVCS